MRARRCPSRSPSGRPPTSAATASVHLADDPRWARAARLLGMEHELERAGYAEILELEPAPGEPLDLTPPAPRSRLAGFVGPGPPRRR